MELLLKNHWTSNLALFTIQESWLPRFAPHMCTYGKPCEEPVPIYSNNEDCIECHMACTFGKKIYRTAI